MVFSGEGDDSVAVYDVDVETLKDALEGKGLTGWDLLRDPTCNGVD